MKDKNKIIAIVGVILVIILLIVVGNMSGGDFSGGSEESSLSNDSNDIITNAENESKAATEDKMRDFSSIDINKYLEYYAGSETKVVLIARPTCHYCQIAEPILKTILFENEGLEINYLNTDDLDDDSFNKLYESNTETFENFGTPMLLIIKENKIIDKVDGLTDKAHYLEFFKNNSLL